MKLSGLKFTKIKWISVLLGVITASVVLNTIPVFICSRGAGKWIEGKKECRVRLANGVARYINQENTATSQFRTGSTQFDGEWLFGTYQMACLGFCQMALQHPELNDEYRPLSLKCIELLMSEEVRAFDAERWREDPVKGISGRNHHAAYLGYLNFVLGLHRYVFKDETYGDLNDRITGSLIGHLEKSRYGLLESYPGELYLVDNSFVIGSIGTHQLATGEDHAAIINGWVEQAKKFYVDGDTRLFVQAVDFADGSAVDYPRGSGTALGLIALHYADPGLARELYDGIKKSLAGTILGFDAVREYPRGVTGWGDIDSGPIIFGYGMSATGFSVAGALRYGDDAFFRRLYATTRFCGAEIRRDGRTEFVSGGPLGNAILFAMLTTPRLENDAR